MGTDTKDEKYAAQMQRLVLAILNASDYLNANTMKASITRSYFIYRGYEPTNLVIQIFNLLDRQGYRIIKK